MAVRKPQKLANRGVKISDEKWASYSQADRRKLIAESDRLAAGKRTGDMKQTHTVLRRALQTPQQRLRNQLRRAKAFAKRDPDKRKGRFAPRDEDYVFWKEYKKVRS